MLSLAASQQHDREKLASARIAKVGNVRPLIRTLFTFAAIPADPNAATRTSARLFVSHVPQGMTQSIADRRESTRLAAPRAMKYGNH